MKLDAETVDTGAARHFGAPVSVEAEHTVWRSWSFRATRSSTTANAQIGRRQAVPSFGGRSQVRGAEGVETNTSWTKPAVVSDIPAKSFAWTIVGRCSDFYTEIAIHPQKDSDHACRPCLSLF
jgi:hypothetical protein